MRLLRLIFTFRLTAARSLAAFADGRVPLRLKMAALGAAIFIVSPLNILGDIPLLGIVDDGTLLLLASAWFARASAPFRSIA